MVDAERALSGPRPYWLSWYGVSTFELHAPWWRSGFDGNDRPIFCAALRAASDAEARAIVSEAHDDPSVKPEFRFVEERDAAWTPYCDRFRKAGWMPEWPAGEGFEPEMVSVPAAGLRDMAEAVALMDADGERARGIRDERCDREVLALCERVGFGAVMDAAARLWFLRDPVGSFVVGPAALTARQAKAAAEEALKRLDAVPNPREGQP